jgi:hypothetical protein
MDRIEAQVSGGCQCGAVRFHATAMLDNAHLCHCRMCQKAVGNLFAALVSAPDDALTWTRGQPATFKSSDHVDRGFCAACGTPLFYRSNGSGRTGLTIGALDEPARFAPKVQHGVEGRMPWFAGLCALPESGTTEADSPEEAAAAKASNRQHPDRDS